MAWGRAGRLRPLVLKPAHARANRVEYRGKALSAWWRILPLGDEEGFTVEHAPAGHGPVVIELRANRAPVLRDGTLAWGRLRYGKLWVTDARGRVLPARLTASGRRIFLRLNVAHARYPIRVDPLVWIQQEVTPSNGSGSDLFGTSVAVSGTSALVGAPYQTVGSNTYQGVAYPSRGGG